MVRNNPDADGLEEQPIPEDTTCPYCGADPTEETQAEHKLSNIGYLHDDIVLECSNDACGEEWTCGVPIGSPEDDTESDLWCDSCEKRFGRIHRVAPTEADRGKIRLHVKCPNPECRYFWRVKREYGPQQVALVGYPDITGQTDGDVAAYGYPEDATDHTDADQDEHPDNYPPECDLDGCIYHGKGTLGCPNAE